MGGCSRLFAAVGAVVVLAVAAVPAATSARGYASLAGPAAAGRIGLDTHRLSVATRFSTPAPARSCYTYDVPDGTGDTTGGLDGVAYQLSFECPTGDWTATATASRSFADSQLGAFEVDFDIDNNGSNNCHGTDAAMLAQYVPAAGRILADAYVFNSKCEAKWLWQLFAQRVTPQSISMSWPDWFGNTPPQRMRSVAFLTGKARPTSSDFDRMPSTGVLTSQRSVSGAFHINMQAVPLSRAYNQVVGGDFNGDGYGDVLFYVPGGQSVIWYGTTLGNHTSVGIKIWGSYRITSGDFDGDGFSDLLLYAPGGAADAVWYGSRSHTFTSQPLAINGTYDIVSSDYNGDGTDDLLFYAPGTATDYMWFASRHRSFEAHLAPPINNRYRIAAGDVNGDGYGDIVLYGPGTASDHVLEGSAAGVFTLVDFTVNGDYSTVRTGDFNGDGIDDLLLFQPGTGFDAMMFGSALPTSVLTPGPQTVIDENFSSVAVGDFNKDSADDVFFLAPPTFPSAFWYGIRHTTKLAANTFGAMAVDPASGRVFISTGPDGSVLAVLDRYGHLVTSITGLSGPTGIAFGPSSVYVAMAGSHSITTYDRTTLAPTGTIDTGTTRAQPSSLSYQHGKLWFTFWSGGAVGQSGGLGVWNPSTSTVSTAATDITDHPLIAAGTAGRDTLVVYDDAGDPPSYARYDVSTGAAVLGVIRNDDDSIGTNCREMTVSPDLLHVFTACGFPHQVNDLSIASLQVTGTHYVTGPYNSAVAATSRGGGWLAAGTSDGYSPSVQLAHIGTQTIVRVYDLDYDLYSRGLAISPDGHVVYAVSGHSYSPGNGSLLVDLLRIP